MIEIREDDISGAPTRALVAAHLAGMNEASHPGTVYALDLSGLERPDITVFSAWIDGSIAGVAALRGLAAWLRGGEVHADPPRSTRDLERLVSEAHLRRITRLSLETGGGPAFEPALALYRRFGFRAGEPFGAYAPSDFNPFLHLEL